MAQWLRLDAPNAGCLALIPGWMIGSLMLQLGLRQKIKINVSGAWNLRGIHVGFLFYLDYLHLDYFFYSTFREMSCVFSGKKARC